MVLTSKDGPGLLFILLTSKLSFHFFKPANNIILSYNKIRYLQYFVDNYKIIFYNIDDDNIKLYLIGRLPLIETLMSVG